MLCMLGEHHAPSMHDMTDDLKTNFHLACIRDKLSQLNKNKQTKLCRY